MNYEEALVAWATPKLEKKYPGETFTNVSVGVEVDPGYACCGGRDPDCYCSFAESASAYYQISANGSKTSWVSVKIDGYMTLTQILQELFEASK